jgi:hypothetical protein
MDFVHRGETRCFLISSGVSAWLLCSRRPSILFGLGANHFRKIIFFFNKSKQDKRCLYFQNSLVRWSVGDVVVMQLITVWEENDN